MTRSTAPATPRDDVRFAMPGTGRRAEEGMRQP